MLLLLLLFFCMQSMNANGIILIFVDCEYGLSRWFIFISVYFYFIGLMYVIDVHSTADTLKRDFIPVNEAKRFIVDCLVAVNTPKKHAELIADLLASDDYRGHFSHGINRIALYVNDIQTGGVNATATPTILNVNIYSNFGN